MLPEAIAYASIANLPAQTGIIALVVGLVCYALAGSSRFAIVSATSSSAAVLAAATASISINGGDAEHRLMLAAGLVIITGISFLLAGLARVGEISSFIAKPVLRGFVFGLALAMILYTESYSSIRSFAAKHGDTVSPNRDLLALGASIGASILLSLASRSHGGDSRCGGRADTGCDRRLACCNRRDICDEGASAHIVILSLEASPDLNSSSLEALSEFLNF